MIFVRQSVVVATVGEVADVAAVAAAVDIVPVVASVAVVVFVAAASYRSAVAPWMHTSLQKDHHHQKDYRQNNPFD